MSIIVKTLEWEDQTDGGASISGRSKRHIRERATTAFCAYFLEHDPDGDTWWVVNGLLGDEVAGPFAEDWQARQAAQEYHETRIRADMVSESTSVTEDVVMRFCGDEVNGGLLRDMAYDGRLATPSGRLP